MYIWIAVGVIAFIAVLILVDREIFFYEGVHLGPRIQGWLYDRWAINYDQGKRESQAQDAERLARPLIEKMGGAPERLVLDVATGTGRLPRALLNEPAFDGRVIAVDISAGMLKRAAAALAAYGDRVILVRHPAVPLPFPDGVFDAVSCLEALELMPAMEAPLAELARVLRPGGVLLTSRGTEHSGRRGVVRSEEQFTTLLHSAGFEQVNIQKWWKLFDLVWACKPGQAAQARWRELTDILRCPACGATALARQETRKLLCGKCQNGTPLSPEGIVLM